MYTNFNFLVYIVIKLDTNVPIRMFRDFAFHWQNITLFTFRFRKKVRVPKIFVQVVGLFRSANLNNSELWSSGNNGDGAILAVCDWGMQWVICVKNTIS